MNIAETIHRQTEDVYTEIVRHYQYLHRHPELSYHEENTSRYVADFLEAEGISFRRNIGGNGLLAWVQGTKPDNGHTVAFVADMDALPVQEKNEIPYKSVH
ncbi:MAG TPA: amidohydrolase, partial [Porphyromonadaceae bacterium]|nr:amidohydrolase [Porphyromonadaceae bacterium]